MRYIERRRWHPNYEAEYVYDEGIEHEVERMAMGAGILTTAPHKVGAWIEKYGTRYRLDQMQSKHFQTGEYRSK